MDAKLKKTMRILGACALARELGVTREHLRKVVIGERRSMRLSRELEKRGIRCKEARA